MNTPIVPDRSDPDRCLSVHWSLPVQCVLHVAHRENWHEAWHPETGNRMRYRYSAGATEELRDGEWHDLGIPGPDFRGPEVKRLAARAEAAEDALERLHARIYRDLPTDGGEVPEPDDEYWARTLADLVAFADEVYRPIADGA